MAFHKSGFFHKERLNMFKIDNLILGIIGFSNLVFGFILQNDLNLMIMVLSLTVLILRNTRRVIYEVFKLLKMRTQSFAQNMSDFQKEFGKNDNDKNE